MLGHRFACVTLLLVPAFARGQGQARSRNVDDPPPVRVQSAAVTGDLRLHQLTSAIFGNNRNLRVLVPDGYDAPENRRRRYPVLYLADGQNLFDPATAIFGPREWHVDETAHQLIAERKIGPMIVVGVDNAGAERRGHEYLPWSVDNSPQSDPNPEGKRYPEFMVKEVMPYVNSHYRTLTDAAHTGIGGSSFGGLISVFVVMARPGVFGRLLVESPSLGVHNAQILDEASGKLWPERVYLGVGTNEESAPNCTAETVPERGAYMVTNLRRLEAVLRNAGLDSARLRVNVVPCATHSSFAWAARMPESLTFLFGK